MASAIRAGAMGYLLKGTPVDEIIEIVRLALRGYTAFGPGATPPVAPHGENDEGLIEILSRAQRLSSASERFGSASARVRPIVRLRARCS